ncbi:MAG: ferritin family protein [Candidatus Scalindua sp.]|nr:ferritin family protein [Candidatus Scalindua sp.]
MNTKKEPSKKSQAEKAPCPDGTEKTLLTTIETSMAEELKASAFYKEVSKQLKDKAARFKFEVMSDAEQNHYELLKEWCEEKYGLIPKTKKIKEAKIVIIEKPKKKATYEDIIKIIIASEERACRFYENAAKKTENSEAKKLFEKLAEIEGKHVDQFKDEFRVITEPSLWCGEEEIPWMLEV